jgi:hypothetical protein
MQVLDGRSVFVVLADGPKRTIAEDAREVLEGPDLQYRERAGRTQIGVTFPPGTSRFGLRTFPPSDLNILTIQPGPNMRLESLVFEVQVPADLCGRLDLRRIEALPPEPFAHIPLRFQRPVKPSPVTRVGFTELLAGLSSGVGWQVLK